MKKFTQWIKENSEEIVDQDKLRELFQKGKKIKFIKNAPVAIAPANKFNINTSNIGTVDKTSYSQEKMDKGYMVFQWDSKNNNPDLYVIDKETFDDNYSPFNGDASKSPSMKALKTLNIDPNEVEFYFKNVPTVMIRASDVDLEDKTISTSWGTQHVARGGFLVQENNGHVYTIAPDENGLPIGYVRF